MNHINVLLIEDNPGDARLIQLALTEAGATEIALECVGRLDDGLKRLASDGVDVVLLDLSLPDADRLDGVEAVGAAAPEVPIVVMTGLADDQVALAAMKAGAQDYLIKGEDGPRVVRRAIRYALERQELLARERTARASAERAARARDEVLGVVSHDLRAPLSTIIMCAHALREPDADRAELGEMIARSAEWSQRIIRDLLDVTAIEAGRLTIRPEPMAPDAVVETVQSMFAPIAAAAGVELVGERAGAPRWVDVDVDRLVQALGNIVANAIRFTPRGGRVTISATTGRDGAAVFRVADTGPGIAPEHLPHLFDRFWQARGSRRGGAGLGLAIAKGIVEAHGGSIAVESAGGDGNGGGGGATFTCRIPTAGAPGPR